MSSFPKALRGSSLLQTLGGAMAVLSEGARSVTGAFDRAMLSPVGPFEFGAPISDDAARATRITTIAQYVRGRGFRLYEPKRARLVNGKTRAERKAEARDRAMVAYRTESEHIREARELGLIGLRSVHPAIVADKLKRHADAPVITDTIVDIGAKPKRARAKKAE